MAGPVAITDPALLERLALSDEAFFEHFLDLFAHFPTRDLTPELFERGLRYPWFRPERSFLFEDGTHRLLHELDGAERAAVVDRHAGPRSGRLPLLAIGSNAAPKNLAIKLAHHEAPEDREVLVLAGELRDVDVVAVAAISAYGAMAATLTGSPGTAVRAAVLLVTPTQLTTLAWGEMPYRVGRLHGAPFTVEDGFDGLKLDAPLAFVSRWGAFAPDGVPAPLAAVPGRERRWPPWTQRELLDRAAAIALGEDGGGAEELVRRVFDDAGASARGLLPLLRRHARPFDLPGWTPIAPDGTAP